MRRLAKTFRKDDYKSNKDYQTIISDEITEYTFKKAKGNRLIFNIDICLDSDDIVSFGGFVFPQEATIANIILYGNEGVIFEYSQQFDKLWNRVGFCFPANSDCENLSVEIRFDSKKLNMWGVNCGIIDLEHYEVLDGQKTEEICEVLNQPHLMPEALYLDHQNSKIVPNIDASAVLSERTIKEGIQLKKCSYCQRYMPIGTTQLSSSFHRHKAKISGYQNECKSCKKFRINDYFNPERSHDQLNESSIITRERKILLRDPEQIIALKDRETGEGLKSQVWKRFKKKCFKCGDSLKLKEVELDHTRPLAYLWPIDQYATCLCSTCNNNKHDSFPAEFYSKEELAKLSNITGLPYDDLIKIDVCEEQLNRIIQDISNFADNLDARTFRSIANKVLEVRPNVNLYEILKGENIKSYNDLQKRLKERKE